MLTANSRRTSMSRAVSLHSLPLRLTLTLTLIIGGTVERGVKVLKDAA